MHDDAAVSHIVCMYDNAVCQIVCICMMMLSVCHIVCMYDDDAVCLSYSMYV